MLVHGWPHSFACSETSLAASLAFSTPLCTAIFGLGARPEDQVLHQLVGEQEHCRSPDQRTLHLSKTPNRPGRGHCRRSRSPPRPRTCRRACLVPPCGHPDRRTCWRYGADLRRRHLPTGNGDASPQCMVIGTRMGERPYLSALGCVSRSRRLIAASITGRGRSISSVWGCTGFVAYHPSLPEPHSPVPKERIPRGPTGTSPPPWSHGSDQTRQSLFLACFPRSRSGPLPHIHGRSFFVSVGYKKGRRGPARMMR